MCSWKAPLRRSPTFDELKSCSPSAIGLPGLPDTVSARWAYVLGVVGSIMRDSGVRIVPTPPRGKSVAPRILLTGEGLYAALAAQLLFAVCRVDGFSVCVSCGSPFVPSRRTRRYQRCYCETCRAKSKAPIRDAMRDYRKRKSDVSSLRAKGLSVSEIAQRLAIPESRVCRYLGITQS